MQKKIITFDYDVEAEINRSGLKKKWIADHLGITPQTLTRILQNKSGHVNTVTGLFRLLSIERFLDDVG